MARKKVHNYYVLVLTKEGPKYVTGIESRNWARFDGTEKPMSLTYERAKEMMVGFFWNGITAVIVDSPFELETQHYAYEDGHFEWKWDKDDKEVEA